MLVRFRIYLGVWAIANNVDDESNLSYQNEDWDVILTHSQHNIGIQHQNNKQLCP